MEKKKTDISTLATNAGKGAATLWDKAKQKAVKAADQNVDGKIDLKDISVVASSISNAVKNTAATVKSNAEARNREADLRALSPIFLEDLEAPDFLMPKLIRVTDVDKKRAESDVCKGSIGYTSILKDMHVVNVFRDKADEFHLTFYPDKDSEIYYIDPSDRDHYIALDEYFSYLKIARVNELQKIAQDLGAKHFRVTYKEQKNSISEKSLKMKADTKIAKGTVSGNIDRFSSSAEKMSVEIAAESIFPGHAPIEPQLNYLKKETSIQTLIAMRMDQSSPILHQKYTLNLSNSSGIKEKDAVKIDAALKILKANGNLNITNEAKNEANRFFEYEIDF